MNLELYLAFGIGRFFEISLPIQNCNEASEKTKKDELAVCLTSLTTLSRPEIVSVRNPYFHRRTVFKYPILVDRSPVVYTISDAHPRLEVSPLKIA